MSQNAAGEAQRSSQTLRVKMVLLGGSGVGKSSLATRFVKGEFKDNEPTVGCAYQTHEVSVNGTRLRFEIWDTAGQEKYHSVTPLYYRGAHAALVVYDISKRESFLRAQFWLKELEQQYIPGSTVVWLVGNKADLAHNRQVSVQEAQSLAEDRGLGFMETSALSGDHVHQLLVTVAYRVHELTWDQRSLSAWDEYHKVDVQNTGFFSSLPSCCNIAS
ncbi:ras-related protein Rab-17-like [Periophthalmus magnuspinnatus]|uniref:ras-related protein Rab-17-like n=1 Tax=Periophthalmus magnuspinnatus TaxID=409849 RepID=UPI00145BA456|nr:ras-related protein Rab-17-like [Periophthalmus magnuspinnatus]